jgi:hypothetical protein
MLFIVYRLHNLILAFTIWVTFASISNVDADDETFSNQRARIALSV